MAKQRLINCDFMNDMTKVSNKAKLLYFMLFINADDRGFIGNAEDIIKILNENNKDGDGKDFGNALKELKRKGLIYEFTNRHECNVYLLIHWYYHNKYKKSVWTNYYKYYCLVELVDNKYVLKEKPLKEKVNENKLNEMKLNEMKDIENAKEESPSTNEEETWDELLDQLGEKKNG